MSASRHDTRAAERAADVASASVQRPRARPGAGRGADDGDAGVGLRQVEAIEAAERDAMRDVLGALGVGLALVDPEGTIAELNEALAELVGRPTSALIGRSADQVLPGLRALPERALVRRTLRDGVPRECRVEYRDERLTRAFDVRIARSARGWLVFEVRDVRETAPLAELVEVSEESALLRELAHQLAHVPDSPSLLRILGEIVLRECGADGVGVNAVQGDEVLVLASLGAGMPPPGFVMPLPGSLTEKVVIARRAIRQANYRSTYPPLQALVEEGGVGEKIIAPLVAYDQVVGTLIVVRCLGAAPFTPRDERRLRLVADHAALALWKSRLLEQTQAADEAKSNFLATMSHELRTPLTALTGYGELLCDEILGALSDNQHEVVERMRGVTQHLTAMIDELLTFSSLETGRERVRVGMVASGDLLQAAVAVIEPLARQKGLDVHVLIPPDAPAVETDPDKVRQILVNLAGNAVKFTARGRVTLSLLVAGDTVRFGVRDTGIGIAPGAQARLFQPFTQLESGLTRRFGGTGLGLYISSRLAGLVGGHIALESAAGQGSLFELVLPIRARRS